MATQRGRPPKQTGNISAQELYRPVLSQKLPPLPEKGCGEEDVDYKWWREQKRRCTYGWVAPNGVYLNPILYFHLNFMRFPIIDKYGKPKDAVPPLYFKQDHVTFNVFWHNRNNPNVEGVHAKDIVATKSRGVHWSFNMCTYLIWTLLITEQSGAFVGPDDPTTDKFRLMFSNCLVTMPSAWKPIKVFPNNAETIGYGIITVNDKGEEEIRARNTIVFASAGRPSSAGVLRGDRRFLVVVDEAGKFQKKNLSHFVNASRHVVELQDVKWGQIIIGGTSDKITNESREYEEMYYEKRPNKISYFIPARSLFLKCMDEFTGECNEEWARELILADRARVAATGDRLKLQALIQEVPEEDWECFQSPTLSAYDAEALDAQLYRMRIDGKDKNWQKGRLEYIRDAAGKRTSTVEFIPDEGGCWHVNVHLMPQSEYVDLDFFTVDDIYKDTVTHSDSKGAMVIWRGEHYNFEYCDQPAAYYYGRPPTRGKLHQEFLKGVAFYTNGMTTPIKGWIENNDEAFVGALQKNGYSQSVVWNNGKAGYKPTEKTQAEQTLLGEEYIASDAFLKNDSPEIVQSFKDWMAKNTDISSCVHSALMYRDMKKTEATRRNHKGDADAVKMPIKWGQATNRKKSFSFQ